MTARTKQSSVLSENPKLMISMGSMCDQYKFAVHDADERYLGDVTAKSEVKRVTASADDRSRFLSQLKLWKSMVTKHSGIVNAKTHRESKRSMCNSVKLHIVESVHGTYAYHLSLTGKSYEPTLCGKRTVMTSISPLNTWNMAPSHIPYKFCAHCHRVAISMGYTLPEPTTNTRRF